mmetsp:Transcript_11466/g.23278  ORF Transcript_11466/g.23278 Transcript_11466/m.23278 type:complete len:181 (+) Transcript_11466:513-1055(+)
MNEHALSLYNHLRRSVSPTDTVRHRLYSHIRIGVSNSLSRGAILSSAGKQLARTRGTMLLGFTAAARWRPLVCRFSIQRLNTSAGGTDGLHCRHRIVVPLRLCATASVPQRDAFAWTRMRDSVSGVTIVHDRNSAERVLEVLYQHDDTVIAWDTETTGAWILPKFIQGPYVERREAEALI